MASLGFLPWDCTIIITVFAETLKCRVSTPTRDDSDTNVSLSTVAIVRETRSNTGRSPGLVLLEAIRPLTITCQPGVTPTGNYQ